MAVIGFSFSKILVEKHKPIKSKIEVKSSLHVKDISKEPEVKLVEKKDTLRFDFEYSIEYAPNLATIQFTGHVLLVADPKDADKAVQDWNKNKTINDDLKLRVYNSIFNRCNVKAFELEEDFNLPLHLKLPSIERSKN